MAEALMLIKIQDSSAYSIGWENLGWFNVYVRIGLLLWSGSRLFGFIGAGATLVQLFGSLFTIHPKKY
ncbi:unnamed protein product [Prunus armeniaca]